MGIAPGANSLVSDDIVAQTKQAMENIKAIIAEAGASINDICKVTIFVLDIQDLQKLNEVYYAFFHESQPTRSTVEVKKLVGNAKIEIEAIAVIN